MSSMPPLPSRMHAYLHAPSTVHLHVSAREGTCALALPLKHARPRPRFLGPADVQIPITKGVEDEHKNALNLVFRIILPIFFYLFAAIFTRMWPQRTLTLLRVSQGFDSTPQKLMLSHNPAFSGPIQIHAMAV